MVSRHEHRVFIEEGRCTVALMNQILAERRLPELLAGERQGGDDHGSRRGKRHEQPLAIAGDGTRRAGRTGVLPHRTAGVHLLRPDKPAAGPVVGIDRLAAGGFVATGEVDAVADDRWRTRATAGHVGRPDDVLLVGPGERRRLRRGSMAVVRRPTPPGPVAGGNSRKGPIGGIGCRGMIRRGERMEDGGDRDHREPRPRERAPSHEWYECHEGLPCVVTIALSCMPGTALAAGPRWHHSVGGKQTSNQEQ